MNREQNRKLTHALAFCSLMAALGTALMTTGGLVPVLTYCSPLLAGVLLVPVLRDRRRIDRRRLADALLVLFITLIPLVWTAVLRNHSYRHYWFAYRTLTPLILCPLCALSVLSAGRHKSA